MFFRFRPTPAEQFADPRELLALRLLKEGEVPISIGALSQLSYSAQRRIYRAMIPPELLQRFNIHPINWRGDSGEEHIFLEILPEMGVSRLSGRAKLDDTDPFFFVELADNGFNGIDLQLFLINDPTADFYPTHKTDQGELTLFGTLGRNIPVEIEAMNAGLSPGQVRAGLRASKAILQHLEIFLLLLGHSSYYVEPLTYTDAWLFERRGFSYVTGLQSLKRIHQEFAPSGRLFAALDGSTPFRQPEQAGTVRGRAWAIHDGILETIDIRWDRIRMVKQIGRPAKIETFPNSIY